MRRHPDWLRVHLGSGKNFVKMKSLLRSAKLHTICEEAKCPNIAECFSNKTAVFLILGDTCTRNCGYCNVRHGKPLPVNLNEPKDISESIEKLKLNYVVITSVTRDDLVDGGASIFHDTIMEIKKRNNKCKIEVLIPDFKGDLKALKTIISSKPDVINHNIEVVRELFKKIRPEGDYKLSLNLLNNIKKIGGDVISKSGFMIGLGETREQIIKTIRDLRDSNVDFLTIGQYLQPTKNHVEIKKYYTPNEYNKFKKKALLMGFDHVESGPLVRSSYHAQDALFKKMEN